LIEGYSVNSIRNLSDERPDWSLTTMMMTAVPFSHRHHTIQPESTPGTLPVHSIH
jgi:hypothetical protein